MTLSSSRRRGAFAALAAGLSIAASASAEPGAVLKKIRETGDITIGYRESSIPFSYLDDKAEPVGYSIELCGRIVEAIKAEAKLPALKVNRQAVTSQNRIPLVANGTVQLECGSTVNPYAIMFAKDDPEFKRIVDGTLTALYKSGEILKIYDRWFVKPIPPKGIALNFALGAPLQRAFAKPTDSANPVDYK